MKSNIAARREFLLQAGGLAGAAWIGAHWPAMLAAAQHAQEAVKGKGGGSFEVLTADQAKQIEAIASQIMPSDDLPGAREAGVVYFIDRALKTFASDARPVYEKGLGEVNKLTAQLFPGVRNIGEATPEQQERVVSEVMKGLNSEADRLKNTEAMVSSDFARTIWLHTLTGFFVDPTEGGNRNYAGWKVIGHESDHMFSPPFGFYDKDYPGWQANSPDTEKR